MQHEAKKGTSKDNRDVNYTANHVGITQCKHMVLLFCIMIFVYIKVQKPTVVALAAKIHIAEFLTDLPQNRLFLGINHL